MSAVQLLQKGVVCAFGEAALLIDKSQHAQFLKGRQTRGEERVKHTAVMMELVIIPLGPHLAAFIITMRSGNSIVIHSIFSFIHKKKGFTQQAGCSATPSFTFLKTHTVILSVKNEPQQLKVS